MIASTSSRSRTERKKFFSYTTGLGLVVTLHCINGVQPVLGRYLQTVTHLPSLSINAIANMITFGLLAPPLLAHYIYKLRRKKTQHSSHDAPAAHGIHASPTQPVQSPANEIELQPQEDVHEVHPKEEVVAIEGHLINRNRPSSPYYHAPLAMTRTELVMTILVTGVVVIVFFICRIGKSIMNLYASKFTSSINTQLVALITPFLVTFITIFMDLTAYLITRRSHQQIGAISETAGEKRKFMIPMNWQMLCTIIVTVFGGVLVVLGKYSVKQGYFTWGIDFDSIFRGQSSSSSTESHSMLGIVLSFVGNCLGAMYTVMITYLASNSSHLSSSSSSNDKTKSNKGSIGKYNKFTLGSMQLVCLQSLVVGVACSGLSVVFREDWTSYGRLSKIDWLIFSVYTVVVYILGESVNMLGTAMAGSITTGALMPTSLVWTALFAFFVLGEIMGNLWQLVGCGLVLVSSILFIVFRHKLQRNQSAVAK